ncbi:hypothetical protein D9M68_659340 [compost metagenome]
MVVSPLSAAGALASDGAFRPEPPNDAPPPLSPPPPQAVSAARVTAVRARQ